METRLSITVMQNLFVTCWVFLNMHTLTLQYKCTFSLSLYICDDNNDYFSLSRHYVTYFIFYIYIYIYIYILYIYIYIYIYICYMLKLFFLLDLCRRATSRGRKRRTASLPKTNIFVKFVGLTLILTIAAII